MIKLICPTCYGDNLTTDDEYIEQTGADRFICKDCGQKTILENVQYE